MSLSSKLDIFALAQQNDPDLESRYQTLLTTPGVDATLLSRFRNHVQNTARVSINMHLYVLNDFLFSKKYKNIHDWANQIAIRGRRTPERLMEEKLREWYLPRKNFESIFVDGEKFYYGLLNIGGEGTRKYGDYCVVVQEKYWEKILSIYLAEDSLVGYMDAKSTLIFDKFKQELASMEQRHTLAALKHHEEIAKIDQKDWPELVCKETKYIEVIFVGSLTPEQIEEVRIEKNLLESLLNSAFDDINANTMGDKSRRMEVALFTTVVEQLDIHNIPWGKTL
ncbi:MAG: hypothetical protein HQL65_00850 [Magnetococcales bacterium]|nr:hypothetical protein [Magnetococcales bacterium]